MIKKHTHIKARVQNAYPIYHQSGQYQLKSIPYLWPKRHKNPTLWGRKYLYSLYKGVPPGVSITCLVSGSVHTTLRKFENGSFTLKTHQMFSSTLRHTTSSFWICVRGNLGQGNHVIIVTQSFSKLSDFKIYPVHTKTKGRRFQIPPVWRADWWCTCGRYA